MRASVQLAGEIICPNNDLSKSDVSQMNTVHRVVYFTFTSLRIANLHWMRSIYLEHLDELELISARTAIG